MADGITKIHSVEGAGAPVGYYSSLVTLDLTVVKKLHFMAGQISLGPGSDELLHPGDAVAQLGQAMKNVRILLESEGATFDNLVAVVILVADFSQVVKLNAAYEALFEGGQPPVRAMFQVGVPKLGLVEVFPIAAQ